MPQRPAPLVSTCLRAAAAAILQSARLTLQRPALQRLALQRRLTKSSGDFLHPLTHYNYAPLTFFRPPPLAGTFTADLFSAGGGACDANPFAKGLSSFTVTAGSAGAGCGITLTPLAASGVTIPALWTASGSGS